MLNKKLGLIALITGVAASGVLADPVTHTITNFTTGDVLVCFQKGGVDMVVDAGPVSTFTGATHNQVIPITQYTGTQLAQLGTNGVSWSAFAWQSDNTLFVTRARTSLNQQTVPWQAASSPVQNGAIGQMATIPPGALDELNLAIYPQSTSTAVVEEGNSVNPANPNYKDGLSYQDALAGAYGGNFDGKFQGSPESITPNNPQHPNLSFTGAGQPQRSDFYQMTPTGSQNVKGTWLGYFELNTNGAMTFVAKPTTMPVLSTFSRNGSTATITYKSGLYGTYNLLATNNASAPLSTWPVVGGNLSSGDTSTHTVQDTDSTSNKFYIIVGQ
jgi:hypothetical protein